MDNECLQSTDLYSKIMKLLLSIESSPELSSDYFYANKINKNDNQIETNAEYNDIRLRTRSTDDLIVFGASLA